MYLIIALFIHLSFSVISIYIYSNNKKIRNYEKITLGEINKLKNKNIYYSKYKGLFEVSWLTSVSIFIWLFAFHSGLNETQELTLTLIGFIIIIIAFFRIMHLLNVHVRFDDNYLYIRKGFKETKYDLEDLKEVEKFTYHIVVHYKNSCWFYFIPLGIDRAEVIYQLLKLKEANKLDDEILKEYNNL